ncbi:hypothetical protein FQA39_LY03066 [Lamprigera yunnana]|nr:hypothetical protein FQA39_LY03066 [Lamprigera yunnana]
MALNFLLYYFFPLRGNDKSNPSSLGLRYPLFRDDRTESCRSWLKSRGADDGAEGLWRVRDNLYDLSSFIERHPGGSEWLELTKGTDITESFETHHLSTKAEELLPKFFVRPAKTPRDSVFTFKDGDFYMTLKKKVRKVTETAPKWPVIRSKMFTDSLLIGYFVFAMMASYYWSFVLGHIAGTFLYLLTVASHNYLHQKDNTRMYFFNLSMMSSRSWRVSHAMSHHMYPNTIKDLEISEMEPFFQYLPTKKTLFIRYVSWLYTPIVYGAMFFAAWIRDNTEMIRYRQFQKSLLIPYIVPLMMYCLTGTSLLKIVIMYAWIIVTGSAYFAFIGLNVGHHHPNTFHDGDIPRSTKEIDWGRHQLDTLIERKETTGSHFIVLTQFGSHTLHHLFPTIDHGILEYLYPAFFETCSEFGIQFRMCSQLELVSGQFKQLARTTPRNWNTSNPAS